MVADPRRYHAEEILRDGGSIQIRAIRSDDRERLLEHFQSLGYHTGLFAGNGFVSSQTGLDAGFEVADLRLAVEHEVPGVLGGAATGDLGIVGLLAAQLNGARGSGDAVILDARVDARTVAVQVGPHIIIIKVKSDVAVKFAIKNVARVAFLGTPHAF